MNTAAVRVCERCGAAERNSKGACLPCKRAHDAKYRADNREKIAAAQAASYQKNKAARLEKALKYRASNKEKIAASAAAHYEKNKQKVNAACAAYYAKNREKVTAKVAEYRARNAEKVEQSKKAWAAENLARINVYSRNRRARVRSAPGKLSPGIEKKLLRMQRGRCACCGQPLGDDYHLDHVMPLVLGGENSDSNVQLLRAKCNLQKNKKHPVDFMRSRGYLL